MRDKDGNIAIKKGEEINVAHWSIRTLSQWLQNFEYLLSEAMSSKQGASKSNIWGDVIQNVHHKDSKGGKNKKNKSEEQKEEKHAKGANYIRFGSDQFNLVFNIMLGIKWSVDGLFDSPYY